MTAERKKPNQPSAREPILRIIAIQNEEQLESKRLKNNNNANTTPFAELSPKEQIDQLTLCIEQICIQANDQFPNDKCMITWNEALLHNKGAKPNIFEKGLAIDEIDEKYFIEKMHHLTRLYPQVSIIGQVSSRQVCDMRMLDEVESHYNSPQLLEVAGSETKDNPQIEQHKKVIQKIRNSEAKNFLRVTNRMYFFEKDNDPQIHTKITPNNEINPHPQNGMFEVYDPEPKHANNMFVTESGTKIFVQTCREHASEIKKSSAHSPDVHLILSDGIGINLDSLHAPNVIHVDSRIAPNHIQQTSLLPQDILLDAVPLKGKLNFDNPIKPMIDPFEIRVINAIQTLLDEKKDQDLETLLNDFKTNNRKTISTVAVCEFLKDRILKLDPPKRELFDRIMDDIDSEMAEANQYLDLMNLEQKSELKESQTEEDIEKRKLKVDSVLRPHLRLVPQREQMSNEAMMLSFKDKLGNYELEDKKLDDIIEDVSDELYKDCEEKSGTDARKLFLEKLAEVLKDHPDKEPSTDPIKLKKLLGKEGLKLYKRAIQEEYQSREFRKAVFIASTKHFKGPSWKDKMILWIGGPSASGKSFARDGLVQMASHQMEKNADDKGNYVVSVDGGVEREVSEVRQLLLQVALSKGYQGIKDLDKQTKFKNKNNKSKKIKSYIEKAAKKRRDLHMAIPATFTNLTIGRIRAYSAMDNVQQIFSRIVGGKTQAEHARFRKTVERLGNERAWYRGVFGKILFNNRRIGCESKKYSKKNFADGVRCSGFARHIYRLCQSIYGKKILDYTTTNDLVFLRNVDNLGVWESSEPTYNGNDPVVRISERGMKTWNQVKNKYPNLETWWKTHQNDPIYSSAIVDQDLGSATTEEELENHPFYMKHKDADHEEIRKFALLLLSHLLVTYGDHPPELLEKLNAAVQRNLSHPSETTNLLLLCDELYNHLILDKEISPARMNVLKQECALAETIAMENVLEAKIKELKSSDSATRRIQFQLDEKEIKAELHGKLAELQDRFGLTVFRQENFSKLDPEIRNQASEHHVSTIFKVSKGKAKGAVFADKLSKENYLVYGVKNAEIKGIYEQAYIMLKLFTANQGYKTPVYILESRNLELKRALTVIGKANDLTLRDANGKELIFDAKASEEVKDFQAAHPEYLDLNVQRAREMDRSVKGWYERVDEVLQLDKLNTLEKLENAEAHLKENIETGKALASNIHLSQHDRLLVSTKVRDIEEKLEKVRTKMTELAEEPLPSLAAHSSEKNWYNRFK